MLVTVVRILRERMVRWSHHERNATAKLEGEDHSQECHVLGKVERQVEDELEWRLNVAGQGARTARPEPSAERVQVNAA